MAASPLPMRKNIEAMQFVKSFVEEIGIEDIDAMLALHVLVVTVAAKMIISGRINQP